MNQACIDTKIKNYSLAFDSSKSVKIFISSRLAIHKHYHAHAYAHHRFRGYDKIFLLNMFDPLIDIHELFHNQRNCSIVLNNQKAAMPMSTNYNN